MRKNQRNIGRRRALGVTLIETVAALALLGSLVSLSFSSRSNINAQYREANLKLQAAALAEKQLAFWHGRAEGPPRRASGVIVGQANWGWRTTVINDPDLVKLDLEILHVQIFAPATERSIAGPVLTVELMVGAEAKRDGR